MTHINSLLPILQIGLILFAGPHPEPRHLEEIVFDANRKTLFLFGGVEQRDGRWSNPETVFEWNGKEWREYYMPGPGSRNVPALIYHPGQKVIYLIGGITETSDTVAIHLDVWIWNGTTWRRVSSDCPVKSARGVYDPEEERILVYGDAHEISRLWQEGDPLQFELWEYKEGSWKKLSADGPRIDGSFEIAYDSHRKSLIIPAWENGNAVVWEWQDNEWKKNICRGDCPVERNRYTLAYHEEERAAYLFGGRNDSHPFLDDFWQWNGTGWKPVKQENGPAGRAAGRMEYGDGRLFLYGGVTGWGITNEIWQWKKGGWKLRNPDEALTAARKKERLMAQLKESPDDAGLNSGYGVLLRYMKHYDEAEKALKKARLLDPEDHNILINLLEVLYDREKDSEAQAIVTAAVQAGNMQRNSYRRLGGFLVSMKKYAGGISCYEKALAMEPAGVDFFYLGGAYALAGEKEKAFPVLHKAIDHGFTSRIDFETSPDLNLLREDSRFGELLMRLN